MEILSTSPAELLPFGQRAVPVMLPFRSPRLVRAILAFARSLATGHRSEAETILARLAVAPAGESTVDVRSEGVIAPTLRAQALARVFLDLIDTGWRILVEDSQIGLIAPRWRSDARGLSPEEVQAEKARVRAAIAARVQEQFERPATRQFILEQERVHFTMDGARSILNLIADGRRLASDLRARGADAIQPYLQPADADAGRDKHTGLLLSDVFRYFRYFWSFPFGSTPGRTVPMLVRDAGQPGHPVCGLIALASAVPRLGARDALLGWTPAWLEAVFAALDMAPDCPVDHLQHLESELARGNEADLRPERVLGDVALMLGVTGQRAEELGQQLDRLGTKTLAGRLRRARQKLCDDLFGEVEDALANISFEGLGIDLKAALKNPERARRVLEVKAEAARKKWHNSRDLARGPATNVARRPTAELLLDPRELKRLASTPLFQKKRSAQAAKLLAVLPELGGLDGKNGWQVLRERVLGGPAPWTGSCRLSGGELVARGLRASLLQRQSRLLASQVADVVVCGALPPYGPLLGGKLAALLALSREPAQVYFERYAMQASEIGSQMAGRPITRPADLIALTTTSFYGIGSSQYERVRLPSGTSWRFVGQSAGHGTLQFSSETSELMQALVRAETGRSLNTSTFGEGPSERLRKVRDGLARLGVDENALMRHGMPRQVYVAELDPGATRPGSRPSTRPWRLRGPTADEVSEFWRERWIGPRLVRMPGLIDDVEAFVRESVLLSNRLVPSNASTTRTSSEE